MSRRSSSAAGRWGDARRRGATGTDGCSSSTRGPSSSRSKACRSSNERRPSGSTTTATCSSPSDGPGTGPRAGCGTSGPTGLCWPPGPSNDRSPSPTTIDRGSCWRARLQPMSSGTGCCQVAALPSPRRTIPGSRRLAVLQEAGAELVEGRRLASRRPHRRQRRRTCCSCRVAGTRTSRSGARRAAASGSTTGSARTCRMASCGTSRSSEQPPATGCPAALRRHGTAPATRTPRSSTWNGMRPWRTSGERSAPG